MGKSAHRELQETAQKAWDESRAMTLVEVLAFLAEQRDSPLSHAEVETAFVVKFQLYSVNELEVVGGRAGEGEEQG